MKPNADRTRSHAGFTLVEVVIGLGIVALAMGMAYQWIFQTAAVTGQNRDRTFAEWVALNRITEVRLANQIPETGRSSGESEMAGQRWRWELDVSETAVEDLLRLDVAVSRADAPDREILQVTGFVGPPVAAAATVDWYRAVGSGLGNAPTPPGDGGDEGGDASGDEQQDEGGEDAG